MVRRIILHGLFLMNSGSFVLENNLKSMLSDNLVVLCVRTYMSALEVV